MSTTLTTTPAADGFRMPGEFEPHYGCWMLWPERPTNWRLGAKPAQEAFAAVATAIATGEPVTVGASRAQFVHARADVPTRSAWSKCPATIPGCATSVRRSSSMGAVRGVDWMFNAWGGLSSGLYFPWDQDDLVARKVLEIEGCDRYRAPFVLEGGAIHVDGEGTLIATEECLLNPNRNPQLDKGQLEILLHEYLASQRDLARQGRRRRRDRRARRQPVLLRAARRSRADLDRRQARSRNTSLAGCLRAPDGGARRAGPAPEGPQAAAAGAAVSHARGNRDIDAVDGRTPRRVGERLAASYVNFYIANSTVVVPLVDSRRDRHALRTLARIFPERRVIGVQAREILLGGGNIHCITQQVPANGARRMNAAPAAIAS